MIYCIYLPRRYKTLVVKYFLSYWVSLNMKIGGVPKRANGAGCKPVDFGLRKFESFPLHQS